MEEKKQLNFDVTPEVLLGEYANLAMIAHSSADFIIDFARTMPNTKPSVRSRIIMSPEHAKRLFLALQENISKYEATFGTINLHQAPVGPRTATPFGTPNEA